MSVNNGSSFPSGLPQMLLEKKDSHFKLLDLLDIKLSKRKKSIARGPNFRNLAKDSKIFKTKDDDDFIIKVYSSHEVRMKIALGYINAVMDGGNLDRCIPSLEYAAIINYYPDLNSLDPDNNLIDNTFLLKESGLFPEIYLQKLLTAAANAVSELKDWDKLDKERREIIACAIFAGASLVGNEGVLVRAVKEYPGLHELLGVDLLREDVSHKDCIVSSDLQRYWVEKLKLMLQSVEDALISKPSKAKIDEILALSKELEELKSSIPDDLKEMFETKLAALETSLYEIVNSGRYNLWFHQDIADDISTRWRMEEAREGVNNNLIKDLARALSGANNFKDHFSQQIEDIENAIANIRILEHKKENTPFTKRAEITNKISQLEQAITNMNGQIIIVLSPSQNNSESIKTTGAITDARKQMETIIPFTPEDTSTIVSLASEEGVNPTDEQTTSFENAVAVDNDGSDYSCLKTDVSSEHADKIDAGQGIESTIDTYNVAEIQVEPKDEITASIKCHDRPLPFDYVDISGSVQEIAKSMGSHDKYSTEELLKLQYSLLYNNNFDWAYWLTNAIVQESEIPLWLVDIIQLGASFQPSFEQSQNKLYELFNEASGRLDELDTPNKMLLAGSIIRPSLMAPHIVSFSLLKDIPNHLSKLNGMASFFEELSSFALRLQPIGDDLLKGISISSSHAKERENLLHETENWFSDAHRRNVMYEGASKVWKEWTKPSGAIRVMVEAARDNKLPDSELNAWEDDISFERKMNETDKQLNRAVHWHSIKYGAREALQRYAKDAVMLARRWQSIHAIPCSEASYGYEILKSLGKKTEALTASLNSINDASIREILGAELLRRRLYEIGSSFEGVGQVDSDPISTRECEILHLTGCNLHRHNIKGLSNAIVHHLANPLTSEQAFDEHLRNGQISAAAKLYTCRIQYLKDIREAETLLKKLDVGRDVSRKRAATTLTSLSEELVGALVRGVISEEQLDESESHLHKMDALLKNNSIEPDEALGGVEAIVELLASNLSNKKEQLQKEFEVHRERIEKDGVSLPETVLERFARLINDGELGAADDLLSRLKQARSTDVQALSGLVPDESPFDLCKDFMESIANLQRYSVNLADTARQIKSGPLSYMPDSTHDSSEEAITDWTYLYTNPKHSDSKSGSVRKFQSALYGFLRWLGYTIESTEKYEKVNQQGAPNYWLHLRISASIASPLPLFGSQSNNTHHFVLVWRLSEPEKIAQWLSNAKINKDHAVTVISFNNFDLSARRRAIHEVRKDGFSPAIIDTNLMLWLCKFPASDRTAALFGACLPGAKYNPYTPDIAGSVPKEMFYGREHTIEGLWDKNGPCIVYGGRQLGKSALLQQVKRRFDDHLNEQFVIYHGLRTTSEIWEQIRRLLISEGILPKNVSAEKDGIKTAISKIIEEQSRLRILILFDECDQFLDYDSQNRFEQISLIRDLMTSTDRRFKVVFTGLHNVQRFQRIPNQPLAHFGEPLCIGPLLPKDAEDLVLKPLTALGYRFEPSTLVQRILSYTNFHPSLIQLFCHELVDEMNRSARVNIDKTPPFIIDENNINHVYKKANLIKKMRDRFDWTLDLDRRYRLLGYMTAFLELSGDTGNEGLTPINLLGHANDFWTNGFSEVNVEELIGLLDEMVGLGLLLKTPQKTYRLRNRNVLALLGGIEEIDEELNGFKNEKFEPPADPPVIRRIINVRTGSSSPLVVTMEDSILKREFGVDLIVGTRALRINDVPDSLNKLIDERHYERETEPIFKSIKLSSDSSHNPKEFLENLKLTLSVQTGLGSNRLIIDGRELQWELYSDYIKCVIGWIGELANKFRHKNVKKFVHVVFLLDSKYIYNMHRNGRIDELSKESYVSMIRMRRWKQAGVRQWFHDVDSTPTTNDEIAKLISNTGGWPTILEPELQKLVSNTPLHLPDAEEFINSFDLTEPLLVNSSRVLAQLGNSTSNRLELADLIVSEIKCNAPHLSSGN